MRKCEVKYNPTTHKRSVTLFSTVPTKYVLRANSKMSPKKSDEELTEQKDVPRKSLFGSLDSQKELEETLDKFASKHIPQSRSPTEQFLPELSNMLNRVREN